MCACVQHTGRKKISNTSGTRCGHQHHHPRTHHHPFTLTIMLALSQKRQATMLSLSLSFDPQSSNFEQASRGKKKTAVSVCASLNKEEGRGRRQPGASSRWYAHRCPSPSTNSCIWQRHAFVVATLRAQWRRSMRYDAGHVTHGVCNAPPVQKGARRQVTSLDHQ